MARIISTNDYENRRRKVVFNSNTTNVNDLPELFNNMFVEGDEALDYYQNKKYMFGDDNAFHEI